MVANCCEIASTIKQNHTRNTKQPKPQTGNMPIALRTKAIKQSMYTATNCGNIANTIKQLMHLASLVEQKTKQNIQIATEDDHAAKPFRKPCI